MYKEYVVEYRIIDTWEFASKHFSTKAEAEAFKDYLTETGSAIILNSWGF